MVQVTSCSSISAWSCDRWLKIDLRCRAARSLVQVGKFSHKFAGFADARFGLARACFRAAAEPLDFSVNKIFERFLPPRLRMQEFFFLFEKGAVVAADAQRPIGINAIELDHVGGDVLKKIAVVADDDARE
jgi:hypothetical protein